MRNTLGQEQTQDRSHTREAFGGNAGEGKCGSEGGWESDQVTKRLWMMLWGAEGKERSLCKESLRLQYTSKEVSAKPKSWNQNHSCLTVSGLLVSLIPAALGRWWGRGQRRRWEAQGAQCWIQRPAGGTTSQSCYDLRRASVVHHRGSFSNAHEWSF